MKKRIASRDNPAYKALKRRVDAGGARPGDDAIVLEGPHLCEAWLAAGGAVREAWVGDAALADREVAGLVDRARADACYAVDDRLFGALSQVAHGVALLFVVGRPRPTRPVRVDATAVFLDRVQDPGNVGSILRSAAAAGIDAAYLSVGCAGPWSTKVLRAAMGAHFRMRVFDDCDLVTLARADAVRLVATSPHAAATIHDVDLARDVAWIFGHEGQGVDPALVADAEAVRIPQSTAVESLNVAAAAAVCFFEQRRQRGAS